jgi:hypothetical protein
MVEYKGISGLYEAVQKLFDLNLALIGKIEVQDRLINASAYFAKASNEDRKKYTKLLEDLKNLNEVHTYKIKEVLAG